MMKLGCAPCCWGVESADNPHNPAWQTLLGEGAGAGFGGMELGPFGCLPTDLDVLGPELTKNNLVLTGGTVLGDLTAPEGLEALKGQARAVCELLAGWKRRAGSDEPIYFILIDFGHPDRMANAGRSDAAPRLNAARWRGMLDNIRALAAVAREYGIRPVVHHHAGGHIEFSDEIEALLEAFGPGELGLLADTGHLLYAGMDPSAWIRRLRGRIDYVHFKDVDGAVYRRAMEAGLSLPEASARKAFCPVGQGMTDYRGVLGALKEIGYEGFITLEQERDPKDHGRTKGDLTKARRYLNELYPFDA